MSNSSNVGVALQGAFNTGKRHRLDKQSIETKAEFRAHYLTFDISLVNDMYLAYSNGYRTAEAIKEDSNVS